MDRGNPLATLGPRLRGTPFPRLLPTLARCHSTCELLTGPDARAGKCSRSRRDGAPMCIASRPGSPANRAEGSEPCDAGERTGDAPHGSGVELRLYLVS